MTQPLTQDAVARDTTEVFVYTFPLFEMLRMRANTAPRRNAEGAFADADPGGSRRWLNTFAHSRRLLKAGQSRVVTPNYDTLYSSAWLDLADGPLVLEAPDTDDRYYVLGLLDAYTNPFAHLGRRTTGTAARQFWLTPPDWTGTVPQGLHHVPCPTPMVWIIGRLLVDGDADVARANALQDGFRIRPAQGNATAGVSRDTGAAAPGLPDDAAAYFARVASGLRENPPAAAHADIRDACARLGLGPHGDGPQGWDAPTRAAIQAAYTAARDDLARGARGVRTAATGTEPARADTAEAPQAEAPRGSWVMPVMLGESFGTDYRTRARIALGYIGALCSAEAVYPMAYVDADGQALDGTRRYRLRFTPDTLPPVDAFWSLTLYATADFMLVDNPLDRYAIGDRSRHLQWGEDGSLEIRIQHEAPADTANWLPAPAGGFYLCLRAYQPREPLLDGTHALPDVERL